MGARNHPKDQFAADMLHVTDEIKKETGYLVSLNLGQVNSMVKTIDNSRKMTVEHEELKGFLMSRYDFVNEVEYTAYERVLNRIYGRRLAAQAA